MSLTDRINDMVEYLDNFNQVNGNFSDDGIINLYDAVNELDSISSDFRKNKVKPEVFDRALSSGKVDEDDHPVFWGNERICDVSGRSSSQIDNDTVFEEAKSKDSAEEAVEFLRGLMKKSGLSKTSVRDAMENGELPQSAYEKDEADHSDPVYVNTDTIE